MKKIKRMLLTIFLIVICISGVAYADNTASSDLQVTKNSSKSINSDLYLTGDSIEVSQNVEGNAFIIGKDVTISSKIDGNLMVMANKVHLTESSYVDASIFIVANDIKQASNLFNTIQMTINNNKTLKKYVKIRKYYKGLYNRK